MCNIYILEILWKKSQCIKKKKSQISGDATEPDKESQF